MNDAATERIVVVALAVIALAIVLGSVVLAVTDHSVPGELWTILGTSVGSLGSILVTFRGGGAVPVSGPAGGPVEVTEADQVTAPAQKAGPVKKAARRR